MDKRMQAAGQLRRALQLFAATLSEEQALEVASVYPQWETDRKYAQGEILAWGEDSLGDPQLYKVAQSHTSQAQWQPGGQGTESLYTPFGLDEVGYPLWSQPTGAHDAYNTGDIVSYNGTLYRSLVDGNVWAPDAYPEGWEVFSHVQQQEH